MLNADTLSALPPKMETLTTTSIVDITPLTLLDYPGELSAIFWFARCNMACPYCYNPHLLKRTAHDFSGYTFDEIEAFLKERANFIDAVVLSGGECTLSPDFEAICERIHRYNLKIKIDTNGSSPEKIESLIRKGYVDAIALDFKAPADKLHFFGVTHEYWEKWKRTLQLVCDEQTRLYTEVRTTYHSELLNQNDIENMCDFLYQASYQGTYYIQNFLENVPTLTPLTTFQKLNKISPITPLKIEIR